MQNPRMAIRNGFRISVVISALFMVGACTQADMSILNFGKTRPDQPPESAKVPQDVHPIVVEARRHVVNLPGRDGADRLSASEIRRVDEIVTAFMADSRGQLVISVPGAAATTSGFWGAPSRSRIMPNGAAWRPREFCCASTPTIRTPIAR